MGPGGLRGPNPYKFDNRQRGRGPRPLFMAPTVEHVRGTAHLPFKDPVIEKFKKEQEKKHKQELKKQKQELKKQKKEERLLKKQQRQAAGGGQAVGGGPPAKRARMADGVAFPGMGIMPGMLSGMSPVLISYT